jgi:hypothetical protein
MRLVELMERVRDKPTIQFSVVGATRRTMAFPAVYAQLAPRLFINQSFFEHLFRAISLGEGTPSADPPETRLGPEARAVRSEVAAPQAARSMHRATSKGDQVDHRLLFLPIAKPSLGLQRLGALRLGTLSRRPGGRAQPALAVSTQPPPGPVIMNIANAPLAPNRCAGMSVGRTSGQFRKSSVRGGTLPIAWDGRASLHRAGSGSWRPVSMNSLDDELWDGSLAAMLCEWL